MSKERPQISLPPEMRCEQIEEREREHHTEALHQLQPREYPLGKRTEDTVQPNMGGGLTVTELAKARKERK